MEAITRRLLSLRVMLRRVCYEIVSLVGRERERVFLQVFILEVHMVTSLIGYKCIFVTDWSSPISESVTFDQQLWVNWKRTTLLLPSGTLGARIRRSFQLRVSTRV